VRILFYPLAGLITVHFRHHDIEQNQIRGVGSSRVQGGLPILSRAEYQIRVMQDARQKAQVIRVVVNHEDAAWFIRFIFCPGIHFSPNHQSQ